MLKTDSIHAADDQLNDAEQVILDANNFKPGTSRLIRRAPVEVILEERHGQFGFISPSYSSKLNTALEP